MPPDRGTRRALVQPPPDGQRDGGAAHEDEERHDHVPEGEANPCRVVEVVGPPVGEPEYLADGDEDAVEGDEHEHVDTAQEIEAEESMLRIFRRAWYGVADGEEKLFHGAIIPRHGSFRQARKPGMPRGGRVATCCDRMGRRHPGGLGCPVGLGPPTRK